MSEPIETGGRNDFLRLPEIWQPTEPVLVSVFAEIPAAVGVPGIHLFWRLLANFPESLAASWPAVAAMLDSSALAEVAGALRARSFIVEAVGMPSHKAFRGDLVRAEIDADFREKLENFNDLAQTALARLLVAAAALRHAAHGRIIPIRRSAAGPHRGVPPDAVYVPPLQDGEAPPKAAALLDRIRNEHDLLLLDDYYRSLGRIVDYLGAAWNAIRPLVGDEVYLARAAELAHAAEQALPNLPAAVPAQAWRESLPADTATRAAVLLDYFVEVLFPQTLMDVTLIKALTSGPDRAVGRD